MSQNINRVFTKYKINFLNREEEMKSLLLRHFESVFERHVLEDVKRIDMSERIRLAGFHEDLSAWCNLRDITLCVCELAGSTQKRYDYKIMFKGEILQQAKERMEDEGSRFKSDFEEIEEEEELAEEKKGFKEFTKEEKEQYRQQKEQEKKEVQEDFQNFLEKQTVKDVVDIIEKAKEAPDYQPPDSVEEAEIPEEMEGLKQIHGYSIRNYLLVLSQTRKRKDDKFIGIINSFWNWKKQKANVLKNPDKSQPYSYKILVPVEKDGVLKGFKLGSVFDISQTDKYEEYLRQTEEIKKEIELQEEIEYDQAVKFVKTNFSDISIKEDLKKGDIKGSYEAESKIINIHEDTSHTAFHELGKHIVFSELNLGENVDEGSMKEEILAEITCYLLMKKFEEESEYKINYNFGYSNVWALNILDEFKFREFEKIYATISDYVKKL